MTATNSQTEIVRNGRRGRPKGYAKTGGRQKGSLNRLTVDVKAAILEAFDKAGGAKYLRKQAAANPTAFLTLLGKVLPLQVNATGEIALRVEVVRCSDDQASEQLAPTVLSTAVVERIGNGHSVC